MTVVLSVLFIDTVNMCSTITAVITSSQGGGWEDPGETLRPSYCHPLPFILMENSLIVSCFSLIADLIGNERLTNRANVDTFYVSWPRSESLK